MNGCQWKTRWTKQPKRKWLPFFMRTLMIYITIVPHHRFIQLIFETSERNQYSWSFTDQFVRLVSTWKVSSTNLKSFPSMHKILSWSICRFVQCMCVIVILFVIEEEEIQCHKVFVFCSYFRLSDGRFSSKIYVVCSYEPEIIRKKFYQDTNYKVDKMSGMFKLDCDRTEQLWIFWVVIGILQNTKLATCLLQITLRPDWKDCHK